MRNAININLSIIIFKEDDNFIAYCPALDISAYGDTEKEAEKAFYEICKIHFDFCIENNTLFDDLIAHGWKISEKEQTIKSPKIENIIKTNKLFGDIINNKEYMKVNKTFTPQYC